MRHFFLFLILLLTPLSFVNGQNPQPQLEPRPAAPILTGPSVRLIKLDVQVMDKSGAPIHGLHWQDFTLLDEDKPKRLIQFEAEDNADGKSPQPLEIILVIDAVNTPAQALMYERDEIKKFLQKNGGRLLWPVSIAFFSETGIHIENDSSRDGNELAARFEGYEVGLRSANLTHGGKWSRIERLDVSLRALDQIVKYEKERPGRKLMVWLSHGWPIFEWGPTHTPKDEQQLFSSITDASTNLQQAQITLYSVDPVALHNAGSMQNFYYENFLKGVSSASRAQPGNAGLQVIAVQSGGRVFASSSDISNAIENCTADAGTYYVLGFEPARVDQPNEYHSLKVTVDRPGAAVRTRTGYYAQP